MAFQEVDRWTGVIAVVTAAPAGEASGRLWAVFPWDPNTNAYIGNIPSIAQGDNGGARIYAENDSLEVPARYYIEAVVRNPDGQPVVIFLPEDGLTLGGHYDSTKKAWVGAASEVMGPQTRIMPSGLYCAWNIGFTASEVGSYAIEIVLYGEAA